MKRTAFIRCWNEENTVLASLLSIENVFSNIVIIYSEINDNSLQLVLDFSNKRPNVFIEKYPYSVFPHHHPIYKEGEFNYENSLAAYYNFGMNICKKIGGSICKIDCDQIYIEEELDRRFLEIEKRYGANRSEMYMAGLWGMNSFIYDNILLLPKDEPFNGHYDHDIYSPNIDITYSQNKFYEVPNWPKSFSRLSFGKNPVWFHFRKRLMGVREDREYNFSLDDFVKKDNSLVLLDDELVSLFEKEIRPLLKETNSQYANVKCDVQR